MPPSHAIQELTLPGNILPDSHAAPSLQASRKALDKSMKADALEQKLQRRPTADELVKEGILEATEVAPVGEKAA